MIYKTLSLILFITILSSCSATKYEKASRFKYYGYKDKVISDNSYEVEYKVNYKTSLRQCVDFALIRASKIAIENDKNFLLKKIEGYRSYERNPKKITGTFVSSAALGEKYALDRVGNVILDISLSNSRSAINSCGICTIISKKYGKDSFEEGFCSCAASNDEVKKAEDSLKKSYSKLNQKYLDKVFDGIDPFNLDKTFNPEKEMP